MVLGGARAREPPDAERWAAVTRRNSLRLFGLLTSSSRAGSHFLSQAGINRDNLTDYSFKRNENGSTTETFRGQFDDQGGIDSATYNSQVQQKLNGDNLSTNIQSQGQVTYTGLNKDEAEASQLDVTVSPLVDPEQVSPNETGSAVQRADEARVAPKR